MLLPYFEERFDDGGESKSNLQRIYKVASAYLHELLKLGNDGFGHSSKFAEKNPRVSDHALFALTRHMLASLDGVKALLGCGCVETCFPLLRSMLEASFGIAYIVEADHDNRARSYQVVRCLNYIKELRRVDHNHADGKQLEGEMASDLFCPTILQQMPEGLSKKADEYRRELDSRPEFAHILMEWERLKRPPGKKRQPDPEWFSLFSGVKPIPNVRALAMHLGWLSFYEFFYREWSNAVHAGNALERFATSDDCVRPLRYPSGYAKALTMAFAIFINGMEKVLSFYDVGMGQSFRNYVGNVLAPQVQRLGDDIHKALEGHR